MRHTDSAGNRAVTPGTGVELDRVAPAPGAQPAVTGAIDDRVRFVAFERAPDAASARIEIIAADGGWSTAVDVPSEDEATITLPDMDRGCHVQVTQFDAAGNGATSPRTTIELLRRALDDQDPRATALPAAGGVRPRGRRGRGDAPRADRVTGWVASGL